MATKRIVPVTRQPAAEGPDVVREDGSWSIYVDAVYCGSRSNQQDAEIEARRLHFDNVEAEQATTADLEALPFDPSSDIAWTEQEAAAVDEWTAHNRRILIDLDCLIAAHEAQEDTKAQRSAWEWLATLTTVTMQGAAYRIPSARWSNTIYTSTATSCSCEARKRCWHQHAAATLDLARENEAIERAARLDWDPDCSMYVFYNSDGLVAGMRQHAQVAQCEGVLVRESAALASLMECY